ncbi:MFS transporter [Streptomyces liangshanensis]|uniref:MFS transporter n=1 Tax=Streptomyces liangshanensis TaxID=2717324 RepID=A0A6G9H3Z9_9ACTN|nr:MFS transporter [Streptomyces liangshanensis]QIQ05245.1 MFS transporter [Streptomyces liangshanensis]
MPPHAISAPAENGTTPPPPPAHRDGNVLRWLGAYTASMIGSNVYFVALAWAAARTGSPGQAGLVLAVGSVPRAVLMLGGGVVADRWGPRLVVIGSDAARCVFILGMAAVLMFISPSVWLLASVALVFGAVDALFLPAVGALPPRITAPGQLARVQGMSGLATRFANVAGAPIGGLTVAIGGSASAFTAAGVLFAVSLPLLLSVRIGGLPAAKSATGTDAEAAAEERETPEAGEESRVPHDALPGPRDAADARREGAGEAGAGTETAAAEKPAGGTDGKDTASPGAGRALLDGLRYIRRHRVLAPLILVSAITQLGFVGPLNIGLVLVSEEHGWGASGLGWIIAAFSAGAAGASLLLTVRGRVPRAGFVMCASTIVGSVAIACIAYAPSVALAAVAAVCVGLLAGLGGALSGALVQTQTEPGYLGRVTSVTTLFGLGIAPLVYPVMGLAIGAWGSGPVFVASAALCAAGTTLGLCVTSLRTAELPG